MSAHGDIIGRKIRVTGSENKALAGLKGRVIDETKNTIKILDEKNREKTLIKSQITFSIDDKMIEGKKIAKRIEERIRG